jgi:hypothetical protein
MKTVIEPMDIDNLNARHALRVIFAVAMISGFSQEILAADNMMPSSVGVDSAMMQAPRPMATAVSSLPGPSGTAVGIPIAADSQPTAAQKSVAMPAIAAPTMINQPTPTAAAPASINLPTPDPLGPVEARNTSTAQKKNEKTIGALEDKIADTAKEAISRMGASMNETTLDDLNAARMAMTKIDALIEIEKKLTDLEKIRQDRKKETINSSPPIPVMPASAFQPPSLPMPSAAPSPVKQALDNLPPVEASFASGPRDIEVKRITGIDGHYTATLESGGQTRTAVAGDKLPDGTLVTSISSRSVTLLQKSKTRELNIKGVDKVYGRTF